MYVLIFIGMIFTIGYILKFTGDLIIYTLKEKEWFIFGITLYTTLVGITLITKTINDVYKY